MYAVGGSDTVEVLDVSCDSPSWQYVASASLLTEEYCGSATIGNALYIAGDQGQPDHSLRWPDSAVLSIVQCYDSDADVWQSVVPMGRKRLYGLGLAELNGQIYAVGGRDETLACRNSGEKYDPVLNEWQPIAGMAKCRSCFGLVSLGNCLYTIGGPHMKCGEKYDPSEDRWSPIPEMNVTKYSTSAAASIGGRLFVIGQSSYERDVFCAELFDPVANRWQMATPPPDMMGGGALAWFPGFDL